MSINSNMQQHPLRKHIEEIVSLTDQEFDYILNHFTPTSKRKHQYLIQEGEPINKEFWVVKGCLKSSFYDKDGKEHIVQFAMENWWITDYDAFHNKTNAKLSVSCLSASELLYISLENREKLSASSPKMQRFWAKKTKLGYIALQNRVLTLLKDTPKERYEVLLRQYPMLFQRVPKKLIAAYLGVSRETLSRLHL